MEAAFLVGLAVEDFLALALGLAAGDVLVDLVDLVEAALLAGGAFFWADAAAGLDLDLVEEAAEEEEEEEEEDLAFLAVGDEAAGFCVETAQWTKKSRMFSSAEHVRRASLSAVE